MNMYYISEGKNGLTLQPDGFCLDKNVLYCRLRHHRRPWIPRSCCLSAVTVNHVSLPEVVHPCSGSPTLLLIQGLCLWVHPLSPALSISPSRPLFPSTSKCTNYVLNPISFHSLFPDLSHHDLTFGLHALLTGLFVSPFLPNSLFSTQQPG